MSPSLRFYSDSGHFIKYSGLESLDSVGRFWARRLEIQNGGKAVSSHLAGTYSLRRMYCHVPNEENPILLGYKLLYPITDSSPRFIRLAQQDDNIVITAGTQKTHDVLFWEGARYFEIVLSNNGAVCTEVI